MITVTGFVENILYQNPDNGYAVLILSEDTNEYTCTGVFGYVGEGEYLEVEGEEVFHDVYGEQIKMHSYRMVPATDEQAMKKYLGSGAIKGIGPALAERIVNRFQDDTFRIIDEEPEMLAEVKGISIRKAMEICNQIESMREMRDVMMFLQDYGISPALSTKIYKSYGNSVYDVIKTNPYRLADDVVGIGFKRADEIARRAGVEVHAAIRIKSGMVYALQEAANMEGHTYLPKEKMVEATVNMLGLRDQFQTSDGSFNMELLDQCYTELLLEKRLVKKEIEGEEAVFAMPFWNAERTIANKLEDLNIDTPEDDYMMGVKLDTIEKLTNISLDELQRNAIIATQNHGVSVITGGPGTGKTTTINAIIKMFESDGLEVSLAAPTGRAAKRMTEATGHDAMTIHRMLEVVGDETETEYQATFGHNEQNPLETDVIIVDEVSMVDTFLICALLRAMLPGTKLVLVGDVNQLPSVGPGNVLKDIIASEKFETTFLTKVYRQEGKSGIVTNAHKINNGEEVELDNSEEDFLYIERNDVQSAKNATIGLITQKLPEFVGSDMLDIQVLTPMRKGNIGVEVLNKDLQRYINPPSKAKKEQVVNGVVFREGDKVMQIKNNYDQKWLVKAKNGMTVESGTGIFNGDIGIITSINTTTHYIEVKFDDDKYSVYDSNEAEQLELAYAITVHKSQGSEYPAVIMPLVIGNNRLMTRNLLYTGITRAMKCVCIVGRKEIFDGMIKNVDEHKRYSGLKWQLTEQEEEQA